MFVFLVHCYEKTVNNYRFIDEVLNKKRDSIESRYTSE